MYMIKSSTKILLEKNLKRFRVGSANSLKKVRKYHDMAEAFVGFVECRGFYYDQIKENAGVSLHSSILREYFGSQEVYLSVINTLFDIKAVEFKEYVHSSRYSICRTFLPRSTRKYSFVPVNVPEYSERLEKCVEKYFSEHQRVLDPEYQEIEKDYYTMFVDLKEADRIMDMKYGYSYFKVKDILQNMNKDTKLDSVFMKAYCTYLNINKLNNKNYKMVERYGRVYTPFHSLPKEFRVAVRSHHKNVSEVLDIHAAFVRFSAAIADRYFKQTGDSKGSEEIRNMIDVLETSDFYSDIDVFNVGRSVLKRVVLSICFSNNANKKWKLNMYNTLKDSIGASNIDRFKMIYRKAQNDPDYKMSSTDIAVFKKLFSDAFGIKVSDNKFAKARDIFRVNEDCKKKLGYMYDSVLFSTVIKCLNTKFPKFTEFLFMFDTVCSNASKEFNNTVDYSLKSANKATGCTKWNKKDLPSFNSVNLSTECQRIESKIMIETIVPALKKAYPNDTWVTLHDAVYSTNKIVDSKELRSNFYKKLDELVDTYNIFSINRNMSGLRL